LERVAGPGDLLYIPCGSVHWWGGAERGLGIKDKQLKVLGFGSRVYSWRFRDARKGVIYITRTVTTECPVNRTLYTGFETQPLNPEPKTLKSCIPQAVTHPNPTTRIANYNPLTLKRKPQTVNMNPKSYILHLKTLKTKPQTLDP